MTECSPLVSVYLVNHNYGRYIREAIDSVLQQTLQDFELIIIDDGSTDDSRSIIEEYTDDARISAIFQKNKGLNVTNNIAMRAASGKYILRLDADDYFDPHALEVMAGFLELRPNVGMVFPDYYHVDEKSNILETIKRHNFEHVTVLDQPAHGACTMMRRQWLLDLGGYDESYRCQDGWDIWVRFTEEYEVGNINLPLFYYRQHGSSLTKNEERILATRSEIIKKFSAKKKENIPTVAVIPVRGKRTDPRSVALQYLGDKKVIDWTIDSTLETRNINTIIITTPDDDIISHVNERYKNKVICKKRPWETAMLNTSPTESVLSALKDLPRNKKNFEALAVLFIESPFRTSRYIDMAIETLNCFETDLVIAVRAETSSYFQHDGSGLKALRNDESLRLEKDDLFKQVGDLAVWNKDYFEHKGKLNTSTKIGHIMMGQKAAFRIESGLDLEVANFMERMRDKS